MKVADDRPKPKAAGAVASMAEQLEERQVARLVRLHERLTAARELVRAGGNQADLLAELDRSISELEAFGQSMNHSQRAGGR